MARQPESQPQPYQIFNGPLGEAVLRDLVKHCQITSKENPRPLDIDLLIYILRQRDRLNEPAPQNQGDSER